MRVASFNVNNVNRRLGVLLRWLDEAAPDVVCLQELKTEHGRFPTGALEAAGYSAAWVGQRTWNGVAVLGRGRAPVVTRRALPGEAEDGQARYLEAAVGGVLIGCLYAPNGNPAPGPKFDYKMRWMARLQAHAAELIAAGVPVVLAGDYNVAPEPEDVYPTRAYDGNALILPETRAAYRRLLAQGWTDAIRATWPEGPVYTFWDYRRQRWERDGGMRLDHLLMSPVLAPRLRAAGVDRHVRGWPDASDHAPVWAEVRDPP